MEHSCAWNILHVGVSYTHMCINSAEPVLIPDFGDTHQFCRTCVLGQWFPHLHVHENHPEGMLNSPLPDPLLIQWEWGGVQESAPPAGSQGMLLLLGRSPTLRMTVRFWEFLKKHLVCVHYLLLPSFPGQTSLINPSPLSSWALAGLSLPNMAVWDLVPQSPPWSSSTGISWDFDRSLESQASPQNLHLTRSLGHLYVQ